MSCGPDCRPSSSDAVAPFDRSMFLAHAAERTGLRTCMPHRRVALDRLFADRKRCAGDPAAQDDIDRFILRIA